MTDKNTLGFFKKNTTQHSDDMAYKPELPVNDTYNGSGMKAITPAEAQSTSTATTIKNSDERKTIRIPSQQYYELQALLEMSPNKYVYELIAELVDRAVQDMSANRPDDLRAYQQAVERIKANDLRRKK
jgi:hypothetical protein